MSRSFRSVRAAGVFSATLAIGGGDAFKASREGSSEEAVQARIKALVEHLERIQERPAQ